MKAGFTITFLLFFLIGKLFASYQSDSLKALLDSSQISEQQISLKLSAADEFMNSNIRESLLLAKQALEEAKRINSKRLTGEANLATGNYYGYMGMSSEALNHLHEALDIFSELKDPTKRIQALQLIGNVYRLSKEFELALDYYLEVGEYAEKELDSLLIIQSLLACGAVYGNISKMDSALVMFREAFELAKLISNKEAEVRSLYYIADVHLYSGKPDQALQLFHNLEKNYDVEKISPRNYTGLLNSITMAYFQINDLKNASNYNKKVWEALEKYPQLGQLSDYYQNCYKLDSTLGNYKSALSKLLLYHQVQDSIASSKFKDQLANFEVLYSLEKKEGEIQQLEFENALKVTQLNQKRNLNIGLGLILLLSVVFIFQVYRSRKQLHENNKLLEAQKKEIELQSQALNLKNSELENVIEELKATQQHLVQSEKMASLGTLTAGVAHEINNPLNFINGGLELISNIIDDIKAGKPDKDYKEQLKEAIEITYSGVDRASAIVDSLMTFSYSGKPKLVEYSVTDIIENTLLFLGSKIPEDVEIIKNYRFNETCHVFPDKLHQVFLNIIDNAFYALKYSTKDSKVLSMSTDLEGKNILIEICNNGGPISEDIVNKIFDPFFTTKDPGKGTGLGLSICYNLIKDHKGTIAVKNNPDGVVFQILIPFQ
ncbi:MAG TPA: hypothetical protein DDX98_03775 [Bacteroidales bacterium]|nr:hypothetical protein [Bacteroidales bacterium]